ncbi:MAG: diaminopimelate epimerase [Ruminococcaceae bacterium]|nr:diaminopimelate epimerase [Oscillospiraceae bacterium]
MNFHKIHALGNDFVVFGTPNQHKLPNPEFIRIICDRHYGIGCDCAVFICGSENADYFMHVYNPDGFEAEICGNALRCSAKYVSDSGFFKKRIFTVETKSGIRTVSVDGDHITAEIGRASIIDHGNLDVSGVSLPYYSVSMGNPHCVIFLTYGIDDREFEHFGSSIEHHPLFPNGTNVEFACVTNNNRIVMRVWERGIGETLSCSTGSCACVAAAQYENLCGNNVQVYQPGGIINVETRNCGNMFINGGCTTSFKGTFIQ